MPRLVEAGREALQSVPVLTGDKVYLVLNRPAAQSPVFVQEIIVAAPISRFRLSFGVRHAKSNGYVPVLRLLRKRADEPWQEHFVDGAFRHALGA